MVSKKTNKEIDSLLASIVGVCLLLLIIWGLENPQIALLLSQQPKLIWFYLVYKFGYPKLVVGILIAIFFFRLIINSRGDSIIRGSRLITSSKLKAMLKKESLVKKQDRIEIGGIPIPIDAENRGIAMFGAPGTGKTQAISQIVAVLKQRNDFRGIIFDRNGDMVRKFYDPKKDLIFNPFDERSVGWCHHHEESVRPKAIAKSLIPDLPESASQPFFNKAGQALMSEFFSKSSSNKEVCSLLECDQLSTLVSFLSGTMAARYVREEKTGNSIMSTLSNYCEFYPYLVDLKNPPLSFYRWASSDSFRWIFLTLRENETDLLRPLHSLVFDLVLKGLMSNEERFRKTAIVIDELGALNRLPSLERLMSEGRKYLGCPILGTQTDAQIAKIYGRDDTRTILQGSQTKLILRCPDQETAKKMSDVIGQCESIQTVENFSRNYNDRGGGETVTFNEQVRISHLVLPDEIKNLPDLQGYLKVTNHSAAFVKIKYQKFAGRARRFIPSAAVRATKFSQQSEKKQNREPKKGIFKGFFTRFF
jgi:hypothetical protein